MSTFKWPSWFLKLYSFLMNLSNDKILHMFVCYAVYIAVFMLLSAPFPFAAVTLTAFIISECVGFGKESLDKAAGNSFDWNDIAADNIGIGLAFLTTLLSLL